MISVPWITLPWKWTIEEVQAGLQVFIAMICTGGIFAFTQVIWQSSSALLHKRTDISLSSLLSVTTVGEVLDIASILGLKILSKRYWKILAQSAIVIILTVATIVSGPIAKASTRTATGFNIGSVPGLLATTNFTERYNAVMDQTDTVRDLNRAGFPYDQLLDYIPDINSTWVYRPEDWNSTWTMSCQKTEDTPLAVVDTGRCLTDMAEELPATKTFFDYADNTKWGWNFFGLRDNRTHFRDVLIFFAGWNYTWTYISNGFRVANMSMDIAAMHLHGVPQPPTGQTNPNATCYFGRGSVSSASYTKVRCSLTRQTSIVDESHRAFPDCLEGVALPTAFNSFYFERMSKQSYRGLPIATISPDELVRFYQAYTITKDYQYPHAVRRPLTTMIVVVQISSTFIGGASLFALLVLLGLLKYALFRFRRRDLVRTIPESKIDWIVRWTLDESGLQAAQTPGLQQKDRFLMLPETMMSDPAQVRSILEGTKCVRGRSRHSSPVLLHTSSPTRSQQAKSPSLISIAESPPIGMVRSDQWSTLSPNSRYDTYGPTDYDISPYEYSHAYNMQQPDPIQSYEMQNRPNRLNLKRNWGYERLS